MIGLLKWCVIEMQKKHIGKQNVRNKLCLHRSVGVTPSNVAFLVYEYYQPLIEFKTFEPFKGRKEALLFASELKKQKKPSSQCLALGRCLYNRINYKCYYAPVIEKIINKFLKKRKCLT